MDSNRTCIERGECRPRHLASKDRKHWCGGKEGRLLHVYALLTPEQCAAIPVLANVSQSIWFSGWMRRGGGIVVFMRACLQCGRVDGRRVYCHCGAPLGRNGWFGTKACERCGYEPYGHYERVGGRMVRVDPPCRCEREAVAVEAGTRHATGRAQAT